MVIAVYLFDFKDWGILYFLFISKLLADEEEIRL